jgi:hypothetical protein
MTYTVFLIPSPMLCLYSLIAARALEDNAFLGNYKTVSELFSRPDLGDVDYIELPWKPGPDIMNRKVFPMSYVTYNNTWHRLCLAAGFRELPRLYALRVGAGARLDKNRKYNCFNSHIDC